MINFKLVKTTVIIFGSEFVKIDFSKAYFYICFSQALECWELTGNLQCLNSSEMGKDFLTGISGK